MNQIENFYMLCRAVACIVFDPLDNNQVGEPIARWGRGRIAGSSATSSPSHMGKAVTYYNHATISNPSVIKTILFFWLDYRRSIRATSVLALAWASMLAAA